MLKYSHRAIFYPLKAEALWRLGLMRFLAEARTGSLPKQRPRSPRTSRHRREPGVSLHAHSQERKAMPSSTRRQRATNTRRQRGSTLPSWRRVAETVDKRGRWSLARTRHRMAAHEPRSLRRQRMPRAEARKGARVVVVHRVPAKE